MQDHRRDVSFVSLDEFLSEPNKLTQMANHWTLPFNENIPYQPSLLKKEELARLAAAVPQYSMAVTSWKSVVGSRGIHCHVKSNATAESTVDQIDRFKTRVKELLVFKLKEKKIRVAVVEKLANEGNAIAFINKDGGITIASRFDFRLYYNETTGKARYEYAPKSNAYQPVSGLENLEHGVDLWHFKNPAFESWVIAPSPIEVAIIIIRLENHGLVANQKFFDQGMIGTALLAIEPGMAKMLQQDKNRAWFEEILRKVKDLFQGTVNAFRLGYIPGLQGVHDLTKTNQDMQFMDLLQKLTPERIAWAFAMVLSNFGTGEQMTMNNVSVFNDALYDRVGRTIEEELAACWNQFLLPSFGITMNTRKYVQYGSPFDDKSLDEQKHALEEWKGNAITRNEYLDKTGQATVADGDVYFHELLQKVSAFDGPMIGPRTIDAGMFASSKKKR